MHLGFTDAWHQQIVPKPTSSNQAEWTTSEHEMQWSNKHCGLWRSNAHGHGMVSTSLFSPIKPALASRRLCVCILYIISPYIKWRCSDMAVNERAAIFTPDEQCLIILYEEYKNIANKCNTLAINKACDAAQQNKTVKTTTTTTRNWAADEKD